jgi:hypothetical protein
LENLKEIGHSIDLGIDEDNINVLRAKRLEGVV